MQFTIKIKQARQSTTVNNLSVKIIAIMLNIFNKKQAFLSGNTFPCTIQEFLYPWRKNCNGFFIQIQ